MNKKLRAWATSSERSRGVYFASLSRIFLYICSFLGALFVDKSVFVSDFELIEFVRLSTIVGLLLSGSDIML